MKATRYYLGVYLDGEDAICQVSDNVDGLSCELLAKPELLITHQPSVTKMRRFADVAADMWGCNLIEINCSKGKGSYRLIKC